ncbi:hypothetical protein PSP6_130121 [Paraburkholderia tropica]|nr:hypothetical protein PSP6_130121 [Paraburkholderia tropica]
MTHTPCRRYTFQGDPAREIHTF